MSVPQMRKIRKSSDLIIRKWNVLYQKREIYNVHLQDICDLSGEIGEGRKNNGCEPAEATRRHRPDV